MSRSYKFLSDLLSGPSAHRPISTVISKKVQKVLRRKRWRPECSYPKPAELLGGGFYDRFLSGPRLPPRTTTITEVVLPEYAKEIIASRQERVVPPDKDAEVAPVPQSNAEVHDHCQRSVKKPFRGRRSRSSKSSHVVLSPLPITHGFGDAEQRADRCRQAIQQRERNTRGVLEGLSSNRADGLRKEGQTEVLEERMSRRKPTAGSNTYPPTLAGAQRRSFNTSSIPLKVTEYFLLSTSVRKYSILATKVRYLRRPPDETFARKQKPTIWDIPRSSSDNSVAQHMPSTPPDVLHNVTHNIGGFTDHWKGEEWRGEEWKDAWEGKGQSCCYPPYHATLFLVNH